jgi:hypothetical protein
MQVQVTVHFAPQIARELVIRSAASVATQQVMTVVKELGVNLRPMHPGSTDPGMASTFLAEAKDEDIAEQLVSRLQALQQFAYIKPLPGMP